MTTRLEVYEAVGRAVEVAQLFEMALGTALLALDALETGSHLSPNEEAYLRLRTETDNLTLGKTLFRIGKRVTLPQDTEALFSAAVHARNFVAHHLFKRAPLGLLEPEGCSQLLAQANSAIAEIRPAYSVAQEMSGALVEQVLQSRA